MGHTQYPIVIPKINEKTNGLIYEVSYEELRKADEYEGQYYKRIRIKLMRGLESWIYVPKQ